MIVLRLRSACGLDFYLHFDSCDPLVRLLGCFIPVVDQMFQCLNVDFPKPKRVMHHSHDSDSERFSLSLDHSLAQPTGLPVSPLNERGVDSLQTDDPLTQSIHTDISGGDSIEGVFPIDVEMSERFVRQEQLGHGGFGSVFRAYDRKLERFVALKVPHISASDADRIHQRVAREATATARLRHPNIVTLFDFIRLGNQSLLVNELIEGETLTQLIGRHPGGCDFRLAANVVQRIAQAIQHAHDQSVLHRDIKPSNILLDKTTSDGELPFCPRLTDFGLATIVRPADAEEHSAAPTETVGTWHYTPPEVITNRKNVHSPQSDIYSLGVVLFELITGRRPFQVMKLIDLFPKVSSGDFLLPRSIRTNVPRDLEAICLRCMSRNPSSRYPTAAALADDLARFLAGDVVLARMPDRSERFVRWLRRNPTPAAIGLVSLFSLLVVVGVIVAANRRLVRLNAQLESINAQLQTALDAKRKTLYEYEQANYAADLANASEAIAHSQLRDARTLLSRYDNAQPLAHHRDIEWDHNLSLISRMSETIWEGDRPLYCICEVGDYYCVAGAASEIVMVDRNSRRFVGSIATWQKEINSLVYDDRHRLIWTSGDDGSVHAYDVESLRQVYHIQAFRDQCAYDMVCLPEISRLACLSNHGAIAIIDASNGDLVDSIENHDHEAICLVAIDSRRIATGHQSSVVRFFDISESRLEQEFRISGLDRINKLSKDPDRPWIWLLVGNKIRIVDIESLRELLSFNTPDEAIGIGHQRDSQAAIVAFRGGVFHQYKVEPDRGLKQVDQWVNRGQRIYDCAVDSQNGQFTTVGADGKFLLWSPKELFRSQIDIAALDPACGKVQAFQVSPETSKDQWPILMINPDRRLTRLNTKTLEYGEVREFHDLAQKFVMVDERRLIAVSDTNELSLFEGAANVVDVLPLPVVFGDIYFLADRWVADMDSPGNRIRLFDLQSERRVIDLVARNPYAVCVSGLHGKVFWNDNEMVMLRSLDAEASPSQLASFSRNAKLLGLSPDETILAIALSDREVHLWDWRANKRIGPVMMHDGHVHAIAFSSAGRTLMTVDDSATLRFWNVTNGQQVTRTDLGKLEGQSVVQARFTPGGNFVVVLYNDNTIVTFRVR